MVNYAFFVVLVDWGLNLRVSSDLYLLSHTSSPFWSGYFGCEVSKTIFLGLPPDLSLPGN
jgi:hypothetical protein